MQAVMTINPLWFHYLPVATQKPARAGRSGGVGRGVARLTGGARRAGFTAFMVAAAVCGLTHWSALNARVISIHHRVNDAGWQSRNSLLPKRIRLSQLWPDMSLTPQSPIQSPRGWRPVYSADDWRAFRRRFGARQDNIIRQRLSARIQLAADMLAAAHQAKRPGYERLLALRAFALTFRYHVGSPLAQRALSLYLRHIHSGNLVQVAPVWTMANDLAFLRATPLASRRASALTAEAANVQLTMLLLNAGQVEDAARVVRHLVIHETRAVRADHPLISAMGTARVLVSQTRAMMNFLAGEYKNMGSDPQSAMNVYLYTRFIRPVPDVRAWLENRWRNNKIGRLSRALLNCKNNIHAQFVAGRYLAAAADPLPPGILRDRVFFAALVHYRAFMNSTETRWDRIDRTLAKIAIQHLIEQGARPNPVIMPLKNINAPGSTHLPESHVGILPSKQK